MGITRNNLHVTYGVGTDASGLALAPHVLEDFYHLRLPHLSLGFWVQGLRACFKVSADSALTPLVPTTMEIAKEQGGAKKDKGCVVQVMVVGFRFRAVGRGDVKTWSVRPSDCAHGRNSKATECRTNLLRQILTTKSRRKSWGFHLNGKNYTMNLARQSANFKRRKPLLYRSPSLTLIPACKTCLKLGKAGFLSVGQLFGCLCRTCT